MDPLADAFDLSPPALSLLAAYDHAVKDAAERAAADAPPATAGDGGEDAGGEAAGAPDDAPALRVVGVPRLDAPAADEDGAEDPAAAADLHGVLLAAGALDLDLSDVAGGVRYTVTRAGRGLLKKAA